LTYRELLSSNPDFRRLWVGQVVSEIGDWLSSVAVLALAIQLAGAGREGMAVAVYAIARHLPLFLFGPLAGVVSDRVDRRRVMIRSDLVRAFLALGFLFASRRSSLQAIYVIGAGLFAVSAFFNAAKRAALPNLVRGAGALLAANSLSASTTAATIAVGSALGGLIATFVGRDPVFLLNALTFIFSAEMIRRIIAPMQKREEAADGPERRAALDEKAVGSDKGPGSKRITIGAVLGRTVFDFREGLRYVRGNRVLSAVFVVAAGWGLGNGVARALYSVFGARLGQEAAAGLVQRPTDFGISVLFVAMGLGGVIGAPMARRFNAGSGLELASRMGRSIILDGCGLTLFSLMPNLWGASLVLVAREINFAIWWTAQQTLMMSSTEDRFSGRVFASYETLTTLMMVAAMLASGAAADTYGIRRVAAAGGIVIVASGLLWFVLRGRAYNERPLEKS
jgi:MFS family permease